MTFRWRAQKGFHPWRCYCGNADTPHTVAQQNIRAACCGGRSYASAFRPPTIDPKWVFDFEPPRPRKAMRANPNPR